MFMVSCLCPYPGISGLGLGVLVSVLVSAVSPVAAVAQPRARLAAVAASLDVPRAQLAVAVGVPQGAPVFVVVSPV
jgi:hypothetical protein